MISVIIPLLAAFVVIYGIVKKVDVYEAFVKGMMQGLPILYKVLPYMAAMMISIQLLRASSLLDLLTQFIQKPLQKIGMPPELLPLALFRPLSGSAAMALVADVFDQYGVDSLLGLTAATMMGSTETIFYTLALYFGSVGIKKTRFTLPVALTASFVSVVASVIICKFLFI